jgi:hypothetical protein
MLTEPFEWNSALLNGDVVDEAAKLREQHGQDIRIHRVTTGGFVLS